MWKSVLWKMGLVVFVILLLKLVTLLDLNVY